VNSNFGKEADLDFDKAFHKEHATSGAMPTLYVYIIVLRFDVTWFAAAC